MAETTPITIDDAVAKLDHEVKLAGKEPAHLWPAITADPKTWSGTKGYIWASAYGDVKEALRAIWTVCQKRGIAIQAAIPALFDLPEDHPQAHKGLVVTFPRRATLGEDIAALVEALADAKYNYGDKAVQGAIQIGQTSLSTRFEHSIDMGRDVDQYEHSILYRPSLPLMRQQVEMIAKELRGHIEGHA